MKSTRLQKSLSVEYILRGAWCMTFDPVKALAELQSALSNIEQTMAAAQAMDLARPNQLALFHDFHARMGRMPTRGDFAEQLVFDIERLLGVSLQGLRCIDIGCRSGENALAMQEAGAAVIGIDPDDLEFGKAQGVTFYKATLQEFHQRFPEQTFDLATVFLWNIPFLERETVAKILQTITKTAIIGYADEPYDKDPAVNVPDLMRRFFRCVDRFECPDSINQYLLKCTNI